MSKAETVRWCDLMCFLMFIMWTVSVSFGTLLLFGGVWGETPTQGLHGWGQMYTGRDKS